MTTSFDATFTNNLERALASDEQLRDTLFGRSVVEAMRALTGSPTFLGHQAIGGTDPDLFKMATRDRVWGLDIGTITGAPRQLTINAGALFADAGAEAPTADDSTYRLGLNTAATAVAIPAGDDLWHLVECRVANTDVTEARDILINPVTRTYAPQVVVKRKLKRLVFQMKTGTGSAIPAPTAGWTPLYAFVIPTAGAALPLWSQIVDFRGSDRFSFPRTENEEDGNWKGMQRVLSRRMATFSSLSFPGSSQGVQFDLTAIVDGKVLHAHTVDTSADITRFLAGGGAPAASTWYYVYLAPSPIGDQCGNVCWAGRQEPVISNCVLLLSNSAPRDDGRNSAALACVAPFSGTNIAIGTGICVGVLHQHPGAAGWDVQFTDERGHVKIASVDLAHSISPHLLAGQAQGQTTSALLPVNVARHVDLQFGMIAKTPTQSAGGVNGKLLIKPMQSGVTAVNNELSFGSILLDPLIQEQYQSITAPLADGDLVSSVGTIDYKIETRDSTGVIIAMPNGLLSQVCNVGASLQCRVTGFQL